jgi:DNA mismatch repair protein MutL
VSVVKLSEDIVRGIAAGEVVERPAAVLKELLENALDAGARRIDVEWTGAGRERLRITDDGSGMSPEDARLSLERHATSKIRHLDDLSRVSTYGFRGEALPSIAAVSRLTLLTRPADRAEAWSLRVEGGRVLRDGPAGGPPGTTITVEDLFFNTPARLKFLKSDGTEKGQLLRTLEDMSLAAPAVAFHLTAEGRDRLNLAAGAGTDLLGELRERLSLLWGEDRTRALRPVRAEGRFLSLHGWVSDVQSPEATSRNQRFFINGRVIVNRRLTHALYDAYRGRLFVGRHPVAALFWTIDPSYVDVNVHPTKREVRLSNEEAIWDFTRRALQEALSVESTPPEALRPSIAGDVAPSRWEATWASARAFPASPPPRLAESRAALELQAPRPEPEREGGLPLEEFRRLTFQPLLQMDATYLLVRAEDRLFIFDQHAAAERVLYERLVQDGRSAVPRRQVLLLPWVWEPEGSLAALVRERREDFLALGYDLEPFGADSFRVNAVPAALGDSPKVRDHLEGLAEDLLTGRDMAGREAFLVRAACRGAVMAGTPLAVPEMDRLVRDLQACLSPWTCPHGRPTFLRLSPDELAKRFRRV